MTVIKLVNAGRASNITCETYLMVKVVDGKKGSPNRIDNCQ